MNIERNRNCVYRDQQRKRMNVREGFKKSKWKFKMAFAMKGEGEGRGGKAVTSSPDDM